MRIMARKKTYDILVAGSGFAGLATAYFLAERGVERIALTDRETGPGLAASARSASMICQLVRDTPTCRLMVRSARLLREKWLSRYADVPFQPCGSLHIGTSKDVAAFDRSAEAAREDGVVVERWSRSRTLARFPALDRTAFEEALWCPSDGIVDSPRLIRALWQDLLKRGHRFAFSADGAVRGTDKGFEAVISVDSVLTAPVLVNAAGAWAGQVARMAGASGLAVEPARRHVFVTAEFKPAPDLPIVWDVTNDVYVRPDGAAVMTSPCDEEPHPAGPTGVSASAAAALEDKLKGFFPAALGMKHTRIWSGLRTFSKDRKFVIGRDPKRRDFYWTACLGGYGVTAAAGCGELTAELVNGGGVDADMKKAFDPGRFGLAPAGL
jgi:D-arginine dehydrogenase